MQEYKSGTAFSGVIGGTIDASSPAWPERVQSRSHAPNVLFIVLDDTGFGQIGCYGSPIETPNIDGLAARGLCYNNMQTTALCSPTRSCILTGRNHHFNAMACITEGATGYPGSNGYIPFENGFLSEILLQKGYSTFAVGKWHLTPAEQVSAAGPYDRWPLGRGFERFYGFMGGDTHQYYPDLVYDNHQVKPNRTPEEGYHLTEDLADKAISFIADTKQVAPDKPFFMYFCPGAQHAPHHVPKEWVDRYKGKFDGGWEAYRDEVFKKQKELGIVPREAELSRHDPDVKPWDQCSAEEKRLFARMMEVYAGFLTHTDHHIGRIIRFLKEIGEFDNTLIMLISDNGASAEGGANGSVNETLFFNLIPESVEDNLNAMDELGGPKYFNHYPWGWAWAGDTPFRRWKRETYRGGISDPFIVCWPSGIKSHGEIRTQYVHAIDMMPTILAALNIEGPSVIKGAVQSPIHGVSLAHTFDDPNAPTKHLTQYFEMIGHRSIYHDGWRAVCPWPGTSFAEAGRPFGSFLSAEALAELDATHWELYHVAEDFTENHNLAEKNPEKLREMVQKWYFEAGKYNVLPIDGRGAMRALDERPLVSGEKETYTYYPGTQSVPPLATARLFNRAHIITAEIEVPKGGADGVLLAAGGLDGGYSFYIKDGKLRYAYNFLGKELWTVESKRKMTAGRHKVHFEFKPTGDADILNGRGAPGIARLYIDRMQAGQLELPMTVPLTFGLAGVLSCGRAPGSPVTPDYSGEFRFTGTIHKVVVDVSGRPIQDAEAEKRIAMARQ
ncbi:MAG: arylsulfatase [Candidatus Abyssobacteria bacterium SURF_5]|uniref:Arylsulfatase n=1 Tax=Abyssobacteria bacterium (strain SURF_5) TaxID=2093360 RepID=A0A3A4NRK3_ABYX5|nr:MAG: arylsulfatase [Candidatus Abyssubacteria bacterium SURF_5]